MAFPIETLAAARPSDILVSSWEECSYSLKAEYTVQATTIRYCRNHLDLLFIPFEPRVFLSHWLSKHLVS